jgi:DME family drug/metabolite transporter
VKHDGAAAGRLLIAGAAFCWGTTATLARLLFRDHDVPPLTAVAVRLVTASLLLGAWLALFRRDLLRIERRDYPYFVVLGVVALSGVQGSYYFSIATLGVGLAILLQYLAPTLILLYDAARGIPVPARTIVAAAAAIVGTALLVLGMDRAAFSTRPLHWAIGLSAAFLFAFYIVYSKRGLARYAPPTVLFYSFVLAGILWSVVTPPWRIAAAGYGAGTWGALLALGLFSTLVPFMLFNAGLRRLSAADAGIVATLEPVIAVASSAIVLGEGLRPAQTAGALLVLLASMTSSSAPRPGTGDASAPA